MEKRYNMRSPAVKRLMREAIELREPTPLYSAQPLEDNLFEWHFTIRGPQGTEFEGGCYHGRVILPSEYPMKPPSIILMTPNGRFELYQKICLSASSYHPELWQPSWSIRTVLLAIIGFMPTEGVGAIGSLDCSAEERKRMAVRSLDWTCDVCGVANKEILPDNVETSMQQQTLDEVADIVSQMAFKSEAEVQEQKRTLSQQQQQQQKQQQDNKQQQTGSNPVKVSATPATADVAPASVESTDSAPTHSEKSEVTTDGGGVANKEPVSQVRRRPTTRGSGAAASVSTPQRASVSTPPRVSSARDPPGGFSAFLVVLLLLCIFVLVARRLIIMFVY